MSLFTPKKNVRNWHQYDVGLSVELIESFVEGIEKQAEESVAKYEKEKVTHVLEEAPEAGYARIVEVHQGLDDETWDLAGIFSEYFPSLQRRSALLTVCSYFEHELDKLCLLYQSEKGFKLALSDLSGKGVDRSTTYLEKVAGLNVHKESKEWDHIKKIQNIRNVIVHQNGKLRDHKGNPIKAAIDYKNQMVYLSGDDEIVLKEGFLLHVVGTYKRYFKLISESIKENERGLTK